MRWAWPVSTPRRASLIWIGPSGDLGTARRPSPTIENRIASTDRPIATRAISVSVLSERVMAAS